MIDDPMRSPHVLAALEQIMRRADTDMRRLISPQIRGLRGSCARILDVLDDAGTRPSTLAEGAWITKQAIGQRLREMQDRGWVTSTPDPSDGRAVLIRRTRSGSRVRRVALDSIAEMERTWSDAVGADRYTIFRDVLDELSTSRRGSE